MVRLLLAAACLASCSAEAPPPADPSTIVAAVDHAELELERARGGAEKPRAQEPGR